MNLDSGRSSSVVLLIALAFGLASCGGAVTRPTSTITTSTSSSIAQPVVSTTALVGCPDGYTDLGSICLPPDPDFWETYRQSGSDRACEQMAEWYSNGSKGDLSTDRGRAYDECVYVGWPSYFDQEF